MPADMRDYLSWLDERGLLKRVGEPLSPILEIPAFLRQVMYAKGPAILFEKVKGHEGWRAAGNLFLSLNTLAEYLGVNGLEEIGERLVAPLSVQPPLSIGEKIRSASDVLKMSSYMPRPTGKAPFLSNIVEADEGPLDALPAFKTWPRDGGRYLTYPLVVTKDPDTGVHTIGVYRVQLLDGAHGVIHWQIHKRGAFYAEKWREGPMPVAVAIGCSLPLLLAAAAPLPHPLDKYLFAGVIAGKGVEVYRLKNGLLVPACAEAVIEGTVYPGEVHEEGPFGDHFGFYDRPRRRYPVFEVEKMYYRDDPIYYGSVAGKPPLEDAVLGRAYERIFLPLIRLILPEVVDMYLPEYGVFQGVAIVSIRKRYPGHAKKVAMALWGLGQTSLTKILVVVDHTVNPHDLGEVIWAVASHVDPQRDVLIVEKAHTDVLDPSTPIPGYGSKLCIDATRKLPEEYGGEPPEEVEEDENVLEKISPLLQRVMEGDVGSGGGEEPR